MDKPWRAADHVIEWQNVHADSQPYFIHIIICVSECRSAVEIAVRNTIIEANMRWNMLVLDCNSESTNIWLVAPLTTCVTSGTLVDCVWCGVDFQLLQNSTLQFSPNCFGICFQCLSVWNVNCRVAVDASKLFLYLYTTMMKRMTDFCIISLHFGMRYFCSLYRIQFCLPNNFLSFSFDFFFVSFSSDSVLCLK